MTHKNLIATAALFLGLSASVTVAADVTEPASVNDWSGFYVGLHAGSGSANSDYKFDPTSDFNNSDISDGFSTNPDGQFAGAQLGYNFQKNNILWGVEADYSWSGIEGSYRNDSLNVNYYFYGDTDVNWLASLRGRAGFVLANTAIYGTGGLAFAGAETTVTSDYAGYPEPGITDSDSKTRSGWVLGGGVETKITSSMTARLEYLHYDFGSESFFYRLDPESDAYDAFGDAYLDVDIVRVGVNLRF